MCSWQRQLRRSSGTQWTASYFDDDDDIGSAAFFDDALTIVEKNEKAVIMSECNAFVCEEVVSVK